MISEGIGRNSNWKETNRETFVSGLMDLLTAIVNIIIFDFYCEPL